MRTKSVTNSTISQHYHQGKTLDKRTNKRAGYQESTVQVYVQNASLGHESVRVSL